MEQIGRYQITGELGRGAMGVVYRALDPAIGRTVALKTIRLVEFADPAEQGRLRERLLHEARSAGILSHPGIVTVYDVAEQGDLAYIAMEFVNGSSLERLLSADQPPAPQTILRVLSETATALDYAHKKGIVHRDIKPANIMIHEDGSVKITDFGVAKISASQQLTQAGTMLGTPNYMSPEQVAGKPVDGRSDVFSLAVIAYEMLTGEKPFSSEQLPTLLYKIVHEDPLAPQRLNPTLTWQIEVVLRRALEKDPASRYPTCTEFTRALEGACKSSKGWKPLPRGGIQSLPTVEVAPAGAKEDSPPLAEPEPERSWWSGKKAAVLATLAVVALAAVAGHSLGWLGGLQPLMELDPLELQPPKPPPAPFGKPSPTAPATTSPEPDATIVQPPEEPPVEPAEQGPGVAETPAPPAAPDVTPAPVPQQTVPPSARPETPPPTATRQQPAPPTEATVLVRTSPPKATVVFDNDPRTACKSPCSVSLPPGRHTASATLAGHRAALRIFQVPNEVDLFFYLPRMSGQVQVLTNPPGASVLINGQQRSETTPVTLDLPVGKYTVAVVKDGYVKDEQDIEVRDNAFVRLNFTLAR